MMRRKLLVLLLQTPQKKKRVELKRSPRRQRLQVGTFSYTDVQSMLSCGEMQRLVS